MNKLNAIGVSGEVGKSSTPINPALALFRQVMIHNPDMPPQSLAICTNGKFALKTPDKFSTQVANCRMPIAYIFDNAKEDELLDLIIKPVCEYMEKYLLGEGVLRKGNGFEMAAMDQKISDALIETVNKVPSDGPIIYMDRRKLKIGVDRLWFNNIVSEIQYMIQKKIDQWRGNPYPESIGMCFMKGSDKGEWSVVARPSHYIKVGPRAVVKVQPTTQDLSPVESRYQTIYAYLAAYALKELVGSIKGYELVDWVALTNMLLAGISGFGQN